MCQKTFSLNLCHLIWVSSSEFNKNFLDRNCYQYQVQITIKTFISKPRVVQSTNCKKNFIFLSDISVPIADFNKIFFASNQNINSDLKKDFFDQNRYQYKVPISIKPIFWLNYNHKCKRRHLYQNWYQ